MSANKFTADSEKNYETKCCVVLVLDTSSSMTGLKIEQLNTGIQSFIDEIADDIADLGQRLEIGIVTFDSIVTRVHEPELAEGIHFDDLMPKGTTQLVTGVREGICMVRERKQFYKDSGVPYYQPWVIVVTDGVPDTDQEHLVPDLLNEIKSGYETKEFFCMALGVRDDSQESPGSQLERHYLDELLQKFTSATNDEIKSRMLSGVKFRDFFKWLSATISEVSKGKDISSIVNRPGQSWDGGFKI